MNLEDLRKKIDEIDAGIIELIGERIRIAEDIGRGKSGYTTRHMREINFEF